MNIEDVPILSALTADERVLLARVMEIRSHRKGHRFTVEGHAADAASAGMFVILEGRVHVEAKRPAGGFAVDKTMGPGEAFGMVALLDDGPRSASVEATEDVRVGFLGRPAFETLTGRKDALAVRFLRVLAQQMADDVRRLERRLREEIVRADADPA